MSPIVFVFIFLLTALIITRKNKITYWPILISWCIALSPVVFNVAQYQYMDDSIMYAFTLLTLIGSYLMGLFFGRSNSREILNKKVKGPYYNALEMAEPSNKLLISIWCLGIFGFTCILIDYYLYYSAVATDFMDLRELRVNAKSASIFLKIGSVSVWGCLYCFLYSMANINELKFWKWIVFFLPALGYFSLSVLTAGRQAAFQLLMLTTIFFVVPNTRIQKNGNASYRWLILFICGLGLVAYMGITAVSRTNLDSFSSRKDLLERIVLVSFSAEFDSLYNVLPGIIGETLVEAIVYFSGSIALFSVFLNLDLPLAFGSMTFPFIFRQLKSLIGIDGMEQLQIKMNALSDIGTFGSGWTSAFSVYIQDFGMVGALIFIFLKGYITSRSINWMRKSGSFHSRLSVSILVLAAIYTPLIPLISDTTFLMLLIFLFAHKRITRVHNNRAAFL